MGGLALVFSDEEDLYPELISGGISIAERAIAACIGPDALRTAEYASRWGASEVYAVEHPLLESFDAGVYTKLLADVADMTGPSLILLPYTSRCTAIAGRLSARLRAACSARVVGVERESLVISRETLGGLALAKVELRGEPKILVVKRGVFPKPEEESERSRIVALDLEIPEPRVVEVGSKPRPRGAELEKAKRIVSVGRGFKKREDLELAERLAELLGAVVGCSRPISADYKWLPKWIGISGVSVEPELYLAVGISGQIQHVAGIRKSRVVVAVNLDPSAPIFEVCDFGIVGDLYRVLPALVDELEGISRGDRNKGTSSYLLGGKRNCLRSGSSGRGALSRCD